MRISAIAVWLVVAVLILAFAGPVSRVVGRLDLPRIRMPPTINTIDVMVGIVFLFSLFRAIIERKRRD